MTPNHPRTHMSHSFIFMTRSQPRTHTSHSFISMTYNPPPHSFLRHPTTHTSHSFIFMTRNQPRTHMPHSFISIKHNHHIIHSFPCHPTTQGCTHVSFIHFHDTYHQWVHRSHSFISMTPTTQGYTWIIHSFLWHQIGQGHTPFIHSFPWHPSTQRCTQVIHSFPWHQPPKDAHTSFIHFHDTQLPPQSFISMPPIYHLIHSFPCHSTTQWCTRVYFTYIKSISLYHVPQCHYHCPLSTHLRSLVSLTLTLFKNYFWLAAL